MIDKITLADFEPYLNQSFDIRFSSEDIQPALLTQVTAWGSASDKYRQPFTLEFETGLIHQYYLQGIFVLIHPLIGDLSLFMVPLGLGKKGMRYEIVIN